MRAIPPQRETSHATRLLVTEHRTTEARRTKPMNKLDAKFSGVIFKIKDGSIVPDDEYVVFLIKDNAFYATLPTYLDNCRKLGADQEQIEAVQRMMARGKSWRDANPDRLKTPDAKGERLVG